MPEIPHAHLIQRLEEVKGLSEDTFLLIEVSMSEDPEVILELYEALLHAFEDTPIRILVTPGHVVERVDTLTLAEAIALRNALDQVIGVKLATTAGEA